MPSWCNTSIRWSVLKPVDTMIFSFGAILRRTRTSARPSITGISMSVMTNLISPRRVENSASACEPSLAVCTR